jgi:hypothetical protein
MVAHSFAGDELLLAREHAAAVVLELDHLSLTREGPNVCGKHQLDGAEAGFFFLLTQVSAGGAKKKVPTVGAATV